MSRYTTEEKAARIAEARDLLRDLEAADELRAARSSHAMPEPSAMQSFGLLPLLSSTRSERFRAEAEEWQRKCEKEREQRKQEEARIVRERQQAEMTEGLTELLGEVIGAERKYMHAYVTEQLAQLRAELAKSRGVAEGAIIDLPAFPTPRKRDPHAA